MFVLLNPLYWVTMAAKVQVTYDRHQTNDGLFTKTLTPIRYELLPSSLVPPVTHISLLQSSDYISGKHGQMAV